jgi:hypothetical protein
METVRRRSRWQGICVAAFGLKRTLAPVGKSPQLQPDGVTIANCYTSVYGGTLATTSTTGLG